MNKNLIKNFLRIFILLTPVFLLSYFFLTSKFILLDDHEVYRLYFGEINFFTAILDDWQYLYRFRPFYWLVRQLESFLFGINPVMWYGVSLTFFATTIVSLYLFFRNIGFKFFSAVVFAWASVLGYQSIGSWMALGVQEGLALCLFSFSLYQLSLYGLFQKNKNLFFSVLLFSLSFLVKETFAFLIPFITVVLLWQEESFSMSFIKKNLLFASGFIFMVPIIFIQSWRSHQWRIVIGDSNQVSFLQIDNLLVYINLLKQNPHLILAFLIFIFLALFLPIFNKKSNKNLIFITTLLLCLLGIGAQFFIYSFTEGISPHYIQPVSLAIILSLAFILKFYSFKIRFILGLIIFLTMPIAFFNTIRFANNHNFRSRVVYAVEQQVAQSDEKFLILVGHRSLNHEEIYSFYKRISYLYPDKKIYFYHYSRNGDSGIFDIAIDIPEIEKDQLMNHSMMVSFSTNFSEDFGFYVVDLPIKPILKKIDNTENWYSSTPLLIRNYL